MGIWKFLGSLANTLLGRGQQPPSSYTQYKTSPRRSTQPPSSQTASPQPASYKDRKSSSVKAPPPSIPDIEIGARSTFNPQPIDADGIRYRCTPEFPNNDDADLEIYLGIDFGTRYSKVCFRNSDSDQTVVVTLDQSSNNLEQALIPSQLAILERGGILTGLTLDEWNHSQWPITQTIDSIKMRLAYLDMPQEDEGWPSKIEVLDNPEIIENLSAYFLARLINRSRNWIQVTYPELFQNRSATWILQVGAPVEYWQGAAIDRFEKVLKLAWALSFTPSGKNADLLTLPQLKQCMESVRSWVEKHPNLDCLAKPEIAAAVWSHIRAAGSREGFFVFFDVGDGTMEGASFRFYRDEGESKIDFYSCFVKPLGVRALGYKLSHELETLPEKIQSYFMAKCSQSDAILSRLSSSQAKKELQKLVAKVVHRGCKLYQTVRSCMAEGEIGSKLDIFMGGGGSEIPFYRDSVASTYEDFGHGQAGIKPYKLQRVPVPQDLNMRDLNSSNFHRFEIAYGLTIPEGEFPEFTFPSEQDAPSQIPSSSEPPDYSDTKDLC